MRLEMICIWKCIIKLKPPMMSTKSIYFMCNEQKK